MDDPINVVKIPENEIDNNDGDGFVECIIRPDNWFGPSIQGGMDCEDEDDFDLSNCTRTL